MDSLDSKNDGFLKHVFNFDNETKSNVLNICQYSVIALVPIVVLNKIMQRYVPEADDEKSSLELASEIFIQIFGIFVGLFFIHRIITYFPTYSGKDYDEFSVTNVILIGLVIIGSLQTKLGEKVSILVERIYDLWNGKEEKGKKMIEKTIPINIAPQPQQITIPDYPQNMSMSGSTSINQLPTQNVQQNIPDMNNSFRSDYKQNNTNIGMPQMDNTILAANEALGGSAFGSNF